MPFFAPSKLLISNMKTDRVFKAGDINSKALLQSRGSKIHFYYGKIRINFEKEYLFQPFSFSRDLMTFAMNSPIGTVYNATVPLNKAVEGI